MEEEARRYYGQLIGSLQGNYPEQKTYTRDQITESVGFQHGATLYDIAAERKNGQEAIRVATPDPEVRAGMAAKLDAYYDRKLEKFEGQFSVAADAVYKQNGITNVQTAEVRSNPRQSIDREDSAATQSWTGERANVRTGHDVEDNIIRSGRDEIGTQGRFNPDAATAQKITATPSRQSEFMTSGQYAAALGDGSGPSGGQGQGQSNPTQPGGPDSGQGQSARQSGFMTNEQYVAAFGGQNGQAGNGQSQPNQATLQHTPSAQARAELGITDATQTAINSPFFREATVSEAQYRAQVAQQKQGQERDVEQQTYSHGPSLSL